MEASSDCVSFNDPARRSRSVSTHTDTARPIYRLPGIEIIIELKRSLSTHGGRDWGDFRLPTTAANKFGRPNLIRTNWKKSRDSVVSLFYFWLILSFFDFLFQSQTPERLVAPVACEQSWFVSLIDAFCQMVHDRLVAVGRDQRLNWSLFLSSSFSLSLVVWQVFESLS